jgi:two-component system response regulator HupR/HoxA
MAEQGTRFPGLPVVLLVDDEPALLDSLGQELQGSCKLFTAASAEKADLLLAARRYDVVVCDHMLPGEQGLDFLEKIMEMMPSTKRILITGYTSPEFISRSMVIAGLSACLVKPVRASEIAAAIRTALGS